MAVAIRVTRTFVHDVDDVDADQEKGGKLDDRLDGDRKHEPALMFGCIAMPRAEEDRERGQDERYDQVHIADRQRDGVGVLRRMPSSTAIACETAFSCRAI